jgi:hypothetical protein
MITEWSCLAASWITASFCSKCASLCVKTKILSIVYEALLDLPHPSHVYDFVCSFSLWPHCFSTHTTLINSCGRGSLPVAFFLPRTHSNSFSTCTHDSVGIFPGYPVWIYNLIPTCKYSLFLFLVVFFLYHSSTSDTLYTLFTFPYTIFSY